MEAQTVFTLPAAPAFSAHALMVSRNGWWLSTAVIVPVVRAARSRVWVPVPHPISRIFASRGRGGRSENAFRVAPAAARAPAGGGIRIPGKKTEVMS